MAKSGQEPYDPSENDRDLVAMLAGNGIPQSVICRFVKWGPMAKKAGEAISEPTLRKAFATELEGGRDIRNSRLLTTAFEMAKTNVAMCIFLLKTQVGLKEPATEVNLHTTYAELVEKAVEKAKADRAALSLVKTDTPKAA